MTVVSGSVLLLVGTACGILVASGIFTFINSLGIITRLAQVTKTAKWLTCYESWICIGASLGNLLWLALDMKVCAGAIRPWGMKVSNVLGNGIMMGFGLFSGIFTGCLIGAIAEILDAFPIMFRRLRFKEGIAVIILALAAGKFTGIVLQFFL